MAGSLTQPNQSQTLPRATTGAQQYRSPDCWPNVEIPNSIVSAYPTAGLWVPGSYASVWDLIEISLPEDSRHEWDAGEMRRWLTIGAGRINEHLGNRGWPVPLTQWSETVVWANTEIAYVGLYRKRGGNTEGDWQNFRDREQAVLSWCKSARDREITPDPRPSEADLGAQAFKYVGDRARGWDQPQGYRGNRRGGY